MAITNNFITTGDNFEGYKIVKYLGPVFAVDEGKSFFVKEEVETCFKILSSLGLSASKIEANAIVNFKIQDVLWGGDTRRMIFCGTAVIIEPVTK